MRLSVQKIIEATSLLQSGLFQSSVPAPVDIRTTLGPRLSPNARIVLPEEASFINASRRFTDYERPTHSAVVQVTSEVDVIETVKYASAKGIPFVAQGGGHSITVSQAAWHDAIMVDLKGLDYAFVSPDGEYLTFGGGALTSQLLRVAYEAHKETTLGSCPCTGALGPLLGGGIGRSMGKYGLMIDNLVSARIVLANGTAVYVSETEHQDLWWAIRGAGHNFGIVTQATLKLHEETNNGLHYVANLKYTQAQAEAVFGLLQNATGPNMPVDLAFFTIFRMNETTHEPILHINFAWAGPKEDASHHIRPFLELNPVFDDSMVSYDQLSIVPELVDRLCGIYGLMRNTYAASLKQIDPPAMKKWFDAWAESNTWSPNAISFGMIESFPQQAVNNVDPDSTAWPWRNGGANHFAAEEFVFLDNSLSDRLDQWLVEQQQFAVEHSGYGRLQNYVNYGHGAGESFESMYGYEPWRRQKLSALKEKYDPHQLFSSYQPIPLPGEDYYY